MENEEIKHEVTAEEIKENNLEGIVEPGETIGIPVDDATPANPEVLTQEDLPAVEFKPEPEV